VLAGLRECDTRFVKGRERRVTVALAIVLGVALALRVAFILGQRGDVLFDHPVVDEERYVALARALAEGKAPDPRPWFHPPGLVYALGAVFSVFGPGLLVPRIVQALVSTASCGLAYLLARRFFSGRVAVATAAVCALHGVLVFESYELLPPTWMLAADLLALWLLVRAKERATPGAAAGAGVAFGVAAVFGPTVLPFVAIAAAWLRKPALAGALLGGAAVAIAPVTLGNWDRGHEAVLVSTNGGINFYLGNAENSREELSIRPGEHWLALESEPVDAGVSGQQACSRWFYDRGLAFWTAHPLRAFGRYARKLYLFFDGPEIPRDTDVYAFRADSPLLRVLVTPGPPWLPDGLLVPLAVVGAALGWRDRRRLVLPYAFVATQAAVVAAFFVTSRYRVPSLPILAMFACAGVGRLASANQTTRARAAGAFVGLALVLNVTTWESAVSYRAELDFYRGLTEQRSLHHASVAVDFFRRAIAEDPRDARYWFELGNALDSTRSDGAVAAWLRAGALDPWDARARRRASMTMAKHGDLDGAIQALRDDVDSGARPPAFYAGDHLNLALLEAKTGRDDDAVREVERARAADPVWFRTNVGGFARTVMNTPDVPPTFRDAVAAISGRPPP
jgi:4-amino-4-deoxy-L-arabinose transferase-like glycosyltransferase